MVADGSENVAQFPLTSGGAADAVSGQQGKLQRTGNLDGGAIACLLLTMKMALQFHVNVAAAKDVRQALDPAARFFPSPVIEGTRQWAAVAVACETDQPIRMFA